MTIQEFIRTSGMTHKQLSERFGIPKRTIEDWSRGARKCPDYVVRMMEELTMKKIRSEFYRLQHRSHKPHRHRDQA